MQYIIVISCLCDLILLGTCQGFLGGFSQFIDPFLRRDRCPYLLPPGNGNVVNPPNAHIGSVATFSCHSGYRIDGLTAISCLSGYSWSGSTPRCIRNSCEKPQDPWNGRALGSQIIPEGGATTFTCDTGYTLSGPTVIICQAGGRWNDRPPTCGGGPRGRGGGGGGGNWGSGRRGRWRGGDQDIGWGGRDRNSCFKPRRPRNGNVITSGRNVPIGGAATFTCDSGYVLKGTTVIVCQAGGRWNGDTNPYCDRIGGGGRDDWRDRNGGGWRRPPWARRRGWWNRGF